jgi:putative endonuclease
MEEFCHVYILTNTYHTVLYTGVTSDLYNRILEHKYKVHPGFTSKYNVHKLIYYEAFEDIKQAIAREKQIKAGSRQKKLDLINQMNPSWEDLFEKEFGNGAQ